MTNDMRFSILICMILFFVASCKEEKKELGDFSRPFVYDNANLLKKEEEHFLDSSLATFEKETSAEIVIFINQHIPNNMDPRGYSLNMFRKFHVGKRFVNNGVLFFLSLDKKNIEIVLGYGIEWILYQSRLDSIVSIMTTHFRKNDFFNGLKKGVDAVKLHLAEYKWQECRTSSDEICVRKLNVSKVLKDSMDVLQVITRSGEKVDVYITKTMDLFKSTILANNEKIVLFCLIDSIGGKNKLLGIEYQ